MSTIIEKKWNDPKAPLHSETLYTVVVQPRVRLHRFSIYALSMLMNSSPVMVSF